MQELEKELQNALVTKEFEQKTIHTNVSLSIKEVSLDLGYINEDNKIKGFSIFSKDFNLNFKSKQGTELAMTI